MNAASQRGVGAPQRRQPEQAERDRARRRRGARSGRSRGSRARRGCGVAHRGRDLVRRLDPRRARDADGERLVRRPSRTGTTIVLERSRPSVAGPSSVNGTIASSTVTEAIVRSSRCGLRTRTRISPGAKLDAADVELVGRRRAAADQVDDAVARETTSADDEREQHDRHERPEPPGDAPPAGSARASIAYSSTWK